MRASRWSRRIAFLVALVIGSAPVSVLAQGKGPAPAKPKTPEEDAYFLHMTNGIRLFNSNDFTTAIAEFEAAYKAVPKASPLINEALCYRELKKYPQAVIRLELAMNKHGDTMTEDDKAGAKQAIEEMKALFAYVTIVVRPGTARVSLDGDDIPHDSLSSAVPVSPGDHVLLAAADGYLTDSKKFSVVSNDRMTVTIDLAVANGNFRIVAKSRDTVIEIDGKAKSPGSWEGSLPAGQHTVRAVGETGQGTIDIVAGKSLTIDLANGPGPLPPLAKPPTPPKRGFYGHANGAVLIPTGHPKVFTNKDVSSGGYFGLRGGYRVHEYAAFEGLLEYGNVEGPANGAGDETYSLSTIRLGGALRLMSPGDLFHFVGTIGGGLTVELMDYDDLRPGHGLNLCLDLQQHCSSNGVDFYVSTEVGGEIDFDHVLIGFSLAVYLNGTKGIEDDPFDTANIVETNVDKPYKNAVLGRIGPRIYIGYAFW